jgi:hypothetical protein
VGQHGSAGNQVGLGGSGPEIDLKFSFTLFLKHRFGSKGWKIARGVRKI